jgi:membrane protein
VSTDEGSAGQAHDRGGPNVARTAGAATGLGAKKPRGLIDEEHRLADRGRELLEREHRLVNEGRDLLHEEVSELREVERRVAERVKVSTPGRIWTRLNAVDFMNSSMQFAALAILCLFPFLVIVAAETGGDARPALIRRLGLDRAAAQDVNKLMSTGTHAAATMGVLGAVFVLLGAIGIASTLQAWYQRVYDQPGRGKWTRHMAAQLIWLAGLVIYLGLQDLFGRELAHLDARLLIYAAFFIVAVLFYWWTQHILLLGRVGWAQLFPAALATGVCVTGLGAFSALLFSGQIVSSDRDYGSIGVVTVLLSYLIGYAVCLHIGAVAGHVWNERRATLAQQEQSLIVDEETSKA